MCDSETSLKIKGQNKREETNFSHLGCNCRTIVHSYQTLSAKITAYKLLHIKTPLPIADFFDIVMWCSVL